jgi:hypothetical protein
MVDPSPPSEAGATIELRQRALQLATDLDQAQLYQAAAHASMVADAVARNTEHGNDNSPVADIELEFELDEHGRVWMIRDGDCHIIGRRLAVCTEMRRFLAAAAIADS